MILAVAGSPATATVSLNLAAELDGVLVDAALALGAVRPGRGPDLHDVAAGRAALHEAVTDLGAVGLVPCGRSLDGQPRVDRPSLVASLARLERRLGPVVVDCPAGRSAGVGTLLDAATGVVLVARATPGGLTAALRVRELARALDSPPARLVLRSAAGLDVDADAVAAALGVPAVELPRSEAATRAARKGIPASRLDDADQVATRVASLAAALQPAVNST